LLVSRNIKTKDKNSGKEHIMEAQQLLSELAIAERNSEVDLKYNRLRYANEVSNVFATNNVTTYYDLVKINARQAFYLRKLAIKEHLL